MASFGGSLDMYRKVPADLLETTKRGSFLSMCAACVMAVLFFLETRAFFTKTLVSEMAIDKSTETTLRLNFNITMLDLSCEYAVIDLVSASGTEQDVVQNVNKFNLDAAGIRKRFHGRNKDQKDILYHDETVTETLEELHDDGEDAEELDASTLPFAVKENQFLFVDFFASWCSHCIRLAPTWETLAEVMHEVATETLDQLLMDKYPAGNHGYSEEDYHAATKVHLPVKIAKVDCVKHANLCREQGILAYPTLRLFVDGERYNDYRGDRTVQSFTNFLAQVEEKHDTQNQHVAKADTVAVERLKSLGKPKSARPYRNWNEDEHPGCQLSGFLVVDRAPGNFHIKARSKSHEFNPAMTNVSHEVHSLSFGKQFEIDRFSHTKLVAPKDFKEKLQPMNGNVYTTDEMHTAYHHHLKIVTTNTAAKYRQKEPNPFYQILTQSQLSHYEENEVPEAKFILDISPVAISFSQKSRKWYDYLTSVMAIVGGSFTVLGMLESTVYAVASKKRRA